MRGSKPTVWDGDLQKVLVFAKAFNVPSPPCGMVTTRMSKDKIPITVDSSKPTVWDGDLTIKPRKYVIVLLFQAHRVGW